MEERSDPAPAGPVTTDRRAERLLRSMDLAEKVAQLIAVPLPRHEDEWPAEELGAPPGVLVVPAGPAAETRRRVDVAQHRLLRRSRHAIPALVLGTALPSDAPRLPAPLALAAAWDADLVAAVAHEHAAQARSAGLHALLGPVVAAPPPDPVPEAADLHACFGADPFQVSTLVSAYVRGAQAPQPDGRQIACVGTHVGGDGARLDGRAGHWDERTMRSHVLAGAEAAVRAGVTALMPSYSSNGGIPAHVDSRLLRDIVRGEWQFPGAVLAAPGALRALSGTAVAGGQGPPLALALESGVDVLLDGAPEERPEERRDRIVALVRSGALPEWLVDDAVAVVLRTKARLGLLAAPDESAPARTPAPRTDAAALLRRAVAAGAVIVSDPAGLVPLPAEEGPVDVVEIGTDPATPPSRVALALVDTLRARFPERRVAPARTPRPGALVVAVLVDRSPGDAVTEVARIVGAGHRCVLLHCGNAVAGLTELVTTTASVVLAWEPTPAHAAVLASVLAGAVEPAGRLPLPVGRAEDGTRRPEALPLGHRAGWSGFAYADLSIAPQRPLPGEPVVVECVVTNTGPRRARDVVLVHLRDRVSSIVRPPRLAGTGAVTLNPGQRGRVRVELPYARFSVWDRAMRHVVEPGTFDVVVGPTTARPALHGTVTLGDAEG